MKITSRRPLPRGTLLACIGTFLAILLVFMQLGFYGSVLAGATMIFDQLDFDLLVTSREYSYLARAGSFPRRRVYQARQLPSVTSSAPFYTRLASWNNAHDRVVRAIFLMGFRVQDDVFLCSEVVQQNCVGLP